MFDSSFGELGLIIVVALIVLGPERLPQVIRFVAKFIGVARAMANSVKEEISQELQLSDLKEEIRAIEQTEMKKISDSINASKSDLTEAKQDISGSLGGLKSEIKDIEKDLSTSSNK
ncbi:Sec-independent protein translocase protein TatB [Vibrio sp. S4M6]|uniref:Sec-independent protein translocase protein TatB n=1 Tax=Vibrio sinus TaxID=2946865 RepID=UPI00202A50F1|nr:Sec-independent protein translocase protein TatB [Vibrio sinus]